MPTGVATPPTPVEKASALKAMPQSTFWTMKNGAKVEIRPIRPDDEQLMIKFHKGLSERTVYMRYFESLSFAARIAHTRLARICFADPERETVLVALNIASQPGHLQVPATFLRGGSNACLPKSLN